MHDELADDVPVGGACKLSVQWHPTVNITALLPDDECRNCTCTFMKFFSQRVAYQRLRW